MSAALKYRRPETRIVPTKESWLDEFPTPDRIERKNRREVQDFIDWLALEIETKSEEFAALQSHANLLGEIAYDLQEKVKRREWINASQIDSNVGQRFHELTERWRKETAHFSLTFKRAMHPAYQRIIGMGEKAVPLILREIQERPSGQWFWALNAITGEDPVQPDSNVEQAIQAWVEWGTTQGYI